MRSSSVAVALILVCLFSGVAGFQIGRITSPSPGLTTESLTSTVEMTTTATLIATSTERLTTVERLTILQNCNGISCFDKSSAGVVYILPSGAANPSWEASYGDRTYFYVYADLESYRAAITSDFRAMARHYAFVIMVVPADDVPSYYHNLKIVDDIAGENNLRILYAIFPKWKYGSETDYVRPETRMHELVLDNMRFMSQLKTTFGIGVWYGWKERLAPEDIRDFYASLPDDVKPFYLTWIDHGFVPSMIEKGLPQVAMKLGIQVVTELYTDEYVSRYACSFERQIVVTGIWDARTASNWRNAVRARLSKASCTLVAPRLFGAWIFWDLNDGHNEKYTAYIEGDLGSPF